MNRIAILFMWLIASLIFAGQHSIVVAADDRSGVRELHDFEEQAVDNAAVKELLIDANGGIEITYSQKFGVTQGKWSARLRVPAGSSVEFFLSPQKFKDWGDFDYFAADVFTEEQSSIGINFELWDTLSKDYSSRCTNVISTHVGQQTVLVPISHPKRNGKEGLTWEELDAKDKINLNALTRVKFFLSAPKEHDIVFWLDNIRLMQDGAAKPKMKVNLPESALAYDFSGQSAVAPGFKAVTASTSFTAGGFGFVSTQGLREWNQGWPDLLTGTFVTAQEGEMMEFRASVPNGNYSVWLAAGKIIQPRMSDHHYLLKLNGVPLCDESPTPEEFDGEKYLYRFMWTQYSERPHALWTNYIDKMFPTVTTSVKVEDGILKLKAINHFLSALILVPETKKAEFDAMTGQLKSVRIAEFHKTYYAPPSPVKPQPKNKDEQFLVFVPGEGEKMMPWSGPSQRQRLELSEAACAGERIVMRLSVVPFVDLGKCELVLSDLTGPAIISKENITGYCENYLSNGASISGSVLLPELNVDIEAGVTRTYWLWAHIADKTIPGVYHGTFTFRSEKAGSLTVPVSLQVYDFQLPPILPMTFGLYYDQTRYPAFPANIKRQKLKEQFQWMRDIGMTGVTLGGPNLLSVGAGSVGLEFDPLLWDLAREVGMGKHPEQRSIVYSLELARAIARRLPGLEGAKVDQDPGIELKHNQFKAYFMDAMRQYREFFSKMSLPVVVNPVDEPREIKNPWNRNLDETNQYSDMIHEVGHLTTYVDVISDESMGKDYTPLIDHCDAIATQAGTSSRNFITKTVEKNKTLWIYNTDCSRLAWGFYLWKVKAKGMWQWHFCAPEVSEEHAARYPGLEWYNPFTDLLPGFAGNAPASKYYGGMLAAPVGLTVSQGINDYAYLYALQETIKENPTHAKAVEAANTFLTGLQQEIPLALFGDPSVQKEAAQCDHKTREWKRKIAELIRDLKQ
jgi:hypothetical protein